MRPQSPGVRHGLCGERRRFADFRGRRRLLVVQLVGAAMFCPQQRDPPAGARGVHHEPVLLQHPHHCSKHASHFAGDRPEPAALRGLRVPHRQLPGDFPDRQHHAEHGRPQH